jgi:hypothetical protein
MNEDYRWVRKNQTPENFVFLRYTTLTLLEQKKTNNIGILAKQFLAGLQDDLLLNVLTGGSTSAPLIWSSEKRYPPPAYLSKKPSKLLL